MSSGVAMLPAIIPMMPNTKAVPFTFRRLSLISLSFCDISLHR